ncbi:MAG: glycosyltransferase [Candidatus Delongbacteria bacterium]|nr:glycosyltransferase [Candidatus Delongbacteria bacterium]
MKIVHIIDSLSAGGKERRLIELLRYLISNYSDVVSELIILSESIDYDEIHDLGVNISIIDRRNLSEISVFFRIRKEFKRIKPDIIHSWIDVGSLHSSFAKLCLNIKFVNGIIASSPQDLKMFSKQWLYAKLSFLFSDIVIGNSEAGIKAYKAPQAKSLCVHNGFNFDRISDLENAGSVKKRLNIETAYNVGMIASFSVNKDYTTFIKSANIVLEKNRNVTFLCIGHGEKEIYRNMVPEKNRDRIIFLDRQKKVESIMNICDIGVLSTWSEGISNSIMEFMALGKPVIATGKGGTKEIINDGVTGYILPQGDHVKMAEKINELINDPELKGKMGKESYNTIKEKFGIERMCSEIYAGYYKLLTEKK